MSSEFDASRRRIKPEKRTKPLQRRADSALEFIETTTARPTKLLYDTTVYIDILQDRFPKQGELMLRAVAPGIPLSLKRSWLQLVDCSIPITRKQARSLKRLLLSSTGGLLRGRLCQTRTCGEKLAFFPALWRDSEATEKTNEGVL